MSLTKPTDDMLDTRALAKAFVHFNGSGTIAIDGTPLNVTSLTDYGTGNYGIHFTVPMSDEFYAVAGICSRGVTDNNVNLVQQYNAANSASEARIATTNSSTGNGFNAPRITVIVHGD